MRSGVLHRCGLFDLIVGVYDDYGTYRCCWQSSPAGRVTQSAGRLDGGARLSHAQFKSIEDRAVDEAVCLQEAAGLDIVTDGEMRRLSFQSQMTEAVDGFGA
jgi:hypothetical protein